MLHFQAYSHMCGSLAISTSISLFSIMKLHLFVKEKVFKRNKFSGVLLLILQNHLLFELEISFSFKKLLN